LVITKAHDDEFGIGGVDGKVAFPDGGDGEIDV